MGHISTKLAAGIPPLCNGLLHCSYSPGRHPSMLWLGVGFLVTAAVVFGLPILLLVVSHRPDTGWWRWNGPPGDDQPPPSPPRGATPPKGTPQRSHRRRPRPAPVSGRDRSIRKALARESPSSELSDSSTT